MNREIKFRGKRVDNGKWVYGFYVQWEDHCNELKHLIFVKSNEDKEFSHMEQYEVIPETVGQFTGLLDKNGKEIYEGDILNSSLYELCVVEYDEFGTFSPFGHGDYAEISTWLKVIGNIHDNPELLK